MLINSSFDGILIRTVCSVITGGDCGLVKDAPCVVLGSHYKLGHLHYRGYLIIITAICNAHSTHNLHKPTTADSWAVAQHTFLITCTVYTLKWHSSCCLVTLLLSAKHVSPAFNWSWWNRRSLIRRCESQHPCNVRAIFRPELLEPFKGSSQDAHLMQEDGWLKLH